MIECILLTEPFILVRLIESNGADFNYLLVWKVNWLISKAFKVVSL